jgi:peptidoglycan hydrolase-like protein with peptidoglycan-binding domain
MPCGNGRRRWPFPASAQANKESSPPSNEREYMKNWLILFLFAASLAVARADQKISEAQQSLKDQGYFYGDVNGEKNTETTDAVRRYQIRNGLSVTGDLDDQTLAAIRKTGAADASAAAAGTPAVASTAAPAPAGERGESQAPAAGEPEQPPSAPALSRAPDSRGPDGVYEGRPVDERNNLFARTPYETAPPAVQQKVIMDAQKTLSERGLFKFPPDGVFNENLEFALRAYQARVGLRPTGRLDLETLAALELLPGSHRRPVPRPRVVPANEPPVRGEWIRP